ncbi:prephenate dehydratase [Sulfurimonas hongkongensis]|uniref:prephenate dehydratase n=1 Tax=Sulfurimonas hongkongensis TaxID=1172190 RepID=T0JNT4_9BACT|nr:prephenate dehydratase [Sulfurimonas hongkongensis]EQB39766.1 prephenate dehydratase [Sulfurimonas hongkongensis]
MKKRVAYQGVEGAYSHLACYSQFPEYETIACKSFDETMYLVEEDKANIAMIPMENSTAGRVEEIYRLIPKMKLFIISEYYQPVNHCLLALPGTKIEDLKSVSSHPQALAQCKAHIEKYNLVARAKFDTAGSAQELIDMQDKTCAAIASSLTAEKYDLEILEEGFQDIKNNTTRFLVLSKEHIVPAFHEHQKYITSIIFEVRNIPAALYKVLGGFATNSVNIIKIESYSGSGTLTLSQFHIDIDGHPDEANVRLALEELAYFASTVKMLGTYIPHSMREILQA